jgi:RNA polymerase sigma-70 factor (ECF subfamily)
MDRQEQFLKLFLTHQGDIRAFILSQVRDRNVCDDLLQEVALTLWRKFEEYDPSRSFGAWARGIAHNKVLQERRDRSRRPSWSFSEEASEAIARAYDETESEAADREEALRGCLEKLPEPSRRMLHDRYEEDLDLETLAQRVGKTVMAAYKTLSRIRQNLQHCIERRLMTESREGGSV